MLPTLVERLLEKTSLLESLFVKLERSNQQLVSLMSEQGQEIRGLREDSDKLENIVNKAGKRLYMLYQLKHAGITPTVWSVYMLVR